MTIKDNVDHEDEYFHRDDQTKLDKLRGKVGAENAATEAEAARVLHHHKCGKCGALNTEPHHH